MHRFTLLHDGSAQGWQATYLAFHIAAGLGAPLQVLFNDSISNEETPEQRAAHVETGGRAADVVIESRVLPDLSVDTLKQNITVVDGLFVPRTLVPDGATASRFLEAFSCPLWIVSAKSEIAEMAVLVKSLAKDDHLIVHIKTLSQRLHQSLTGFVPRAELDLARGSDLAALTWVPLPSFTVPDITSALELFRVGLLFVPASSVDLMVQLSCNCVVYPDAQPVA